MAGVTTRTVDVTALGARGRFAVDMPKDARIVSSLVVERPSLLIRLWVELPSPDEILARTDASGLLVVQYARRRVELLRRRFVVDGRGTRELSLRELR